MSRGEWKLAQVYMAYAPRISVYFRVFKNIYNPNVSSVECLCNLISMFAKHK